MPEQVPTAVDMPLDEHDEPLAQRPPVELEEMPEAAAVPHPEDWMPDHGDDPDDVADGEPGLAGVS